MMNVEFILLSEGSSDAGLVPHLASLCVRAGAAQAEGQRLDLAQFAAASHRSSMAKLVLVKLYDLVPDLVFVHRDGDNAGRTARVQEIQSAAVQAKVGAPVVPVIPIRSLEAWLLADPGLIRRAAGDPNGRQDLGLPRLKSIEAHADPKACLQEALRRASHSTGRGRRRFNSKMGRHVAMLLDNLDIDGPVTALSSWQALVQDIEGAIAQLQAES